MADDEKLGTVWADEELDLIVADYFDMLALEQRREAYVKASHRAVLMERIGRTNRSVEFKHMNISAVLRELGMPWIAGYKPKPNYQRSIFAAIDRYLSQHPHVLSGDRTALLALAEPAEPFIEPPPSLMQREQPRPDALERLIRKFDPAERDFRNRTLGRAGEEFVVDFERSRLARFARQDLARKVRWISQEEGDGAGYDVLSFDASGAERLIEVKTTCGADRTPFYLTRNERSLADERPDAFRIYRLFHFAQQRRLFELAPPLDAILRLEPTTYKASFG